MLKEVRIDVAVKNSKCTEQGKMNAFLMNPKIAQIKRTLFNEYRRVFFFFLLLLDQIKAKNRFY